MLSSFARILYATDLGEHAPKVFGYAVSLARRFGSEIHLLHAIEPLGPTAQTLVRTVVPHETLYQIQHQGLKQLHDDIHRRLSDFAMRELGAVDEKATLVTSIIIAEGHPDKVILDHARSVGADVIVLGTHSRSALDTVLIGSVARKVIHLSPVPVLLVPIPPEN